MFSIIMNSQRVSGEPKSNKFQFYLNRVLELRSHDVCVYQPHWPFTFMYPQMAEYLTLGRACIDGVIEIPDTVTGFLKNWDGEFFIQAISPYVTLKKVNYFRPCGIPQDQASDGDIERFYTALASWLKDNGLIDRAFVWVDEPPDPNHAAYKGAFIDVSRRIERIVQFAGVAGVKTCASFYNSVSIRYWWNRGLRFDRYYLRIDDIKDKPSLREPGQLCYVPYGAEIGHYWAKRKTVSNRGDLLNVVEYALEKGATSLLHYSADNYWENLRWFDGIAKYSNDGSDAGGHSTDYDIRSAIEEINNNIEEIKYEVASANEKLNEIMEIFKRHRM